MSDDAHVSNEAEIDDDDLKSHTSQGDHGVDADWMFQANNPNV